MNEISEFFLNLSDSDIREAVLEMKSSTDGCILSAGRIRKMTDDLHEVVAIPFGHRLEIVKIEVVKAAAFKWAETPNPVLKNSICGVSQASNATRRPKC